jgi:hypothetical protein
MTVQNAIMPIALVMFRLDGRTAMIAARIMSRLRADFGWAAR